MARLTLVTGGSRSGKSDHALALALKAPGPRAFVATCPLIDDELRARVRRHQEERGPDWITVEEPLRLSRALEELDDAAVVLVDCLTLWINNLLFAAETENRTFDEYAMEAEARRVLDTAAARPFPVIFVTNEVGAGITPENKSARLYRDLVGRCNRMFAQRAEEVYLVACGLPLTLKRSSL